MTESMWAKFDSFWFRHPGLVYWAWNVLYTGSFLWSCTRGLAFCAALTGSTTLMTLLALWRWSAWDNRRVKRILEGRT